jgi:queuosine biosynthesis protein QueD
MYKISREYTFAAAHRIEGHPKCGRLHGHNYKVVVELLLTVLPANGMVMDYGDMDKIIKPIVDEMDHRYLVSRENRNANDPYALIAGQNGDIFDLPTNASTAESLAAYLYSLIANVLRTSDVGVESVQVDESFKSSATFYPA